MEIVGKGTIVLYGRSYRDIFEDVISLFPNPSDLHGQEILITWEEEEVLDQTLGGMFWPVHFTESLRYAYERVSVHCLGFKSHFTFEGDIVHFKLSYE